MLYQSKPSIVEAVQWNEDNWSELKDFAGDALRATRGRVQVMAGKDGAQGWVDVPVGHWVVRKPGDKSDHWPVEAGYFADKYEPLTIKDFNGDRDS